MFSERRGTRDLIGRVGSRVSHTTKRTALAKGRPHILVVRFVKSSVDICKRRALTNSVLEEVGNRLLTSKRRRVDGRRVVRVSPSTVFIVLVRKSCSRPGRGLSVLCRRRTLQSMHYVHRGQICPLPLCSICSSKVEALSNVQCVKGNLCPSLCGRRWVGFLGALKFAVVLVTLTFLLTTTLF